MVNKQFKKKIELTKEDLQNCSGDAMSFEYYLLECNNTDNDCDFGNITGYGVEIVKIVKDKPVESKSVNNITMCKKTAVEIIDMLAKNVVTPVELPYILDDMVGVKFC